MTEIEKIKPTDEQGEKIRPYWIAGSFIGGFDGFFIKYALDGLNKDREIVTSIDLSDIEQESATFILED